MEVSRTVTNYGVNSSSFSKIPVGEEDSDSTEIRVVRDEDHNASTQNMGKDQKATARHGQAKGLFYCLKGIVNTFQLIFHCPDDGKDPLLVLEDPSPQGQVEIENESTHGSTAERGEERVTAAVRRPTSPKSPRVHTGSDPQHN